MLSWSSVAASASPVSAEGRWRQVAHAAVTLTQQEWDALGKHGVAQIPRNKRPIAFGMILEPLDEADRAFMKNTLPGPVRLLYPLLIDRPWRKYAATLRTGT